NRIQVQFEDKPFTARSNQDRSTWELCVVRLIAARTAQVYGSVLVQCECGRAIRPDSSQQCGKRYFPCGIQYRERHAIPGGTEVCGRDILGEIWFAGLQRIFRWKIRR